jgi:glucose/arabinose dehydrogenase
MNRVRLGLLALFASAAAASCGGATSPVGISTADGSTPLPSTAFASPAPSGADEPSRAPDSTVKPGGTFTIQKVIDAKFAVALAFAPDYAETKRVFYTERDGRVRVLHMKASGPALDPKPFIEVSVRSDGERGLLGICFDRDYATNKHVYVFYDQKSPLVQRVVRYTDRDNVGTDEKVLLDNLPTRAWNHNGGNIGFGADGYLYVTLGDDARPENSESFTTTEGKLLRITRDGAAAPDNPWGDSPWPASGFWAMGLRNSFDFCWHPVTGDLYASENGPHENDEVNRIERGKSYGWGKAQKTGRVGIAGQVDPVDVFARPPSLTGICAYSGAGYPAAYYGDVFIGAWNTHEVHRADLDAPDYVYRRSEPFLKFPAPVVDVCDGADGVVWVTTRDAIYRIVYAEP